MLNLRSTWLAGGSALLLVVALTGLAAAAPLVSDTSQGFVDLDGNGVADQCELAVAADPVAAAAAFAAVDTDGDGTISVREAAHSDWVGGKNSPTHGGYVSSVAGTADDADEPAEDPAEEPSDADCTRPGRLPGDRTRAARRGHPGRHGPERPRQGGLPPLPSPMPSVARTATTAGR